MIEKLKQWAIKNNIIEGNIPQKSPEEIARWIEEERAMRSDVIEKGMAHYCEICDRGFTTRGGTKNHKRLKHKNVDNT
jgi:uncharacterized protein YuzB (UPF0349 family)